MALPSLSAAVRRGVTTLQRFPLALLSGMVAAGALMAIIDGPSEPWMARLCATAALGLPLFTALSAAGERLAVSRTARWVGPAIALAALVALYFAAQGWTDRMATLRFGQLLLAAHLLVAVLPYWGESFQLGFWQFNRMLFLQFLLAAFYTLVLWSGLALALAAIDKLLGVDVPNELYAHLFAFLAFVFHPWFLLAYVPADLRSLDQKVDYPTGLKVFTQFVLIPLVTVYLIILTAYLGRVIVTRTWPSGWIGWLVSGVSTAGVLALLLVHPIRERADSRWVNVYGRWFFVALMPPLGMLVVAIGKRVGQYGLTEPRYYLLALTFWLIALAVYYAVSASKNIKLIPLTLLAVAAITTFGPWGAYAQSRRSQQARLTEILSRNGVVRSSTTSPLKAISVDDRREASAILRYLDEAHGLRAIATATGAPMDSVVVWDAPDTVRSFEERVPGRAMRHLGLDYVNRWSQTGGPTFSLVVREQSPVDVTGFDWITPIHLTPNMRSMWGADSISLATGPDLRSVVVYERADSLLVLDIGSAVRGSLDSLAAGSDASGEGAPVIVEGDALGLRVRLVFQYVNGERADQGLSVTSASGYLLVRRRPR